MLTALFIGLIVIALAILIFILSRSPRTRVITCVIMMLLSLPNTLGAIWIIEKLTESEVGESGLFVYIGYMGIFGLGMLLSMERLWPCEKLKRTFTGNRR